jgi:hypothetical protein
MMEGFISAAEVVCVDLQEEAIVVVFGDNQP